MLKKMRTFYSLLPVFLPLLLLWPFSVQPSFPPVADNMVLIKGGTFLMGDAKGEDDEKPVHQVTVSDFYLSKYEVTVADFKAFVDATGYKTVAEQAGQSYVWLGNNWELRKGVHWRHDSKGNILHSGDYQHPVIHVSWDDAMAYCAWLSRTTGQTCRLPTEAEWEYAAGNGAKHTRFSWGPKPPGKKKVGNLADRAALSVISDTEVFPKYDDGYAYTAPVGSFPPNKLGLYDMTGNVWEWCHDWYSDDYYDQSPAVDPTGPASGDKRVWRGGSWLNAEFASRITFRSYGVPDEVNFAFTGFRVARSRK